MPWVTITGGAGGIGQALVHAVQDKGWQAASLDRVPNPKADRSLIDNVADEAAVAGAFAQFGPLRGLVCIAGTNARGRVEDLSWEEWRRVMAIVLTASVSAHVATGGSVAYHTS